MIVITVNKEKFLKEREIKKLFDKSSITLNFRTMGAKNSEVENTKKSVNIDVYSSKELQKFNENQKKNGLSIYTEKQISGVTLKPWTNLAC